MVSAVLPQILRENLDYLEQLQESYRSSQDQSRLLGIREVYNSLSAACQSRENDVRGVIQGLVSKVSAYEKEVQDLESAASAEGRLSCLKESTELSMQNVNTMTSQERELKERLEELQLKVRDLQSGTQGERAKYGMAMDRLKYELSLYAHISKTTLSLAPGGTELIAAVSKPTTRDVLELKLGQMSGNDIESVDRLWDAME